MYELSDYLAMVDDEVRTPAYLAAMRATIRPGDHVLELGTGFGYFAVQACRMGAAHVYAIEPNDAIALGPALAAANGCADRITFIQDHAERVALPRRADVLIEDLRGMSPLHHGRLATLADAHRRLLVPAARTVPRRDLLICAPTELPDGLPTADDRDAGHGGVTLAPIRERAATEMRRTRAGADALLAEGRTWATLDLTAPADPSCHGTAEFVVRRDGQFAGLLSWFATDLAEGVGFDTAPGGRPTVYDRAFLPLGTPLAVRAGDELAVTMRAVHDGSDYIWSWTVTGRARDGKELPSRQGSTLGARLMSAARRARRAAGYRPTPSPAIAAMRTLLESVDGATNLEAIAAALARRHPERFADPHAALRWAGERLAALDEDPG